jgi:hypothetical protein
MALRLRTHTRFLRKPLLVVQVSEEKPYNYDPMVDIAPGGYTQVWRDATPDDLINAKERLWPTQD